MRLQPVPLSKLKDGFLDGTSSTYLEELEERFRVDPSSVDKTWASFFNNLGSLKLSPRLPNAAKAAVLCLPYVMLPQSDTDSFSRQVQQQVLTSHHSHEVGCVHNDNVHPIMD